jgi:hypothetical protein
MLRVKESATATPRAIFFMSNVTTGVFTNSSSA